jgi:hypothetical protein
MASLSRLESEYSKLRKRRRRRRPWTIAAAAMLLFGSGAAGYWLLHGIWRITPSGAAAAHQQQQQAQPQAQSQARSASPADATSAAPQNERKLTLWSPPKIDTDEVPIMYSYETGQSDKLRVQLFIKPQGEADFREASLLKGAEIEAAAGRHLYSLQWDKAKDGIKTGQFFDIKLILKGAASGAAPAGSSDTVSGSFTLEGVVRNAKLDTRENVRNAVNRYMISYGKWTEAQLAEAKKDAQLVIVDTSNGNISAEEIQALRAGVDPQDASDDVLVLGYISVGEDRRTQGLKPEDMKRDPRFVLDGSGPSVDPRPGGPYPNGGGLPDDLDVNGKPTGGGFAPFYLNDNFVADGIGTANVPEFNLYFGGAFVNPGHPEWLKALTDMTLARDRNAGLKELLTADYGEGFGCDGLFLDTLDTAAPNSYTDGSSANVSEYEWTAKGTKQLLQNIRKMYPDKLLLGNRGLFFYNPDLPAFAYTLRGTVDFVLFESFRLDSRGDQWFDPSYFNDNKYNFAQKLLAEADRSDGFRVLSLGYAEGPDGAAAQRALLGENNGTVPMLMEDVKETEQLGMVHYLTNAKLTVINNFAGTHRGPPEPPVWGSTQTPAVYGKPFDKPREGIGRVFNRGKDVYVQWDVAHSEARPIEYVLYAKEGGGAFDWNKPLEAQAAAFNLTKGMPADYAGPGDRSNRYPYESKLEGLTPGKTYSLLLRARNAAGQTDTNTKTVKWTIPR